MSTENPPDRSENISPTSVDEESISAARKLSLPALMSSAVSPAGGKFVRGGPSIMSPKSVNSLDSPNYETRSKSELVHEIESLKESLQQALDDKAELIEESFLDKERIKDQKETIESLTKRIREFEMTRNATTAAMGLLPAPTRTLSAIKQLNEDNAQLAREVDRLMSERDKIEKKLIDLKIKYAKGSYSSTNASTDDDDNDTTLFSTIVNREQKTLGANKKSSGWGWFGGGKKSKNASPVKRGSLVVPKVD